ncbi:hypothetical protein NA78x_004654 [Anatilimnocola sp. NA78]|uniref:hypothetical protein n=1 Tax=Anatilimnocola sp. NA78 TaxID=3415683 RepID=UPI003CE4D4E4
MNTLLRLAAVCYFAFVTGTTLAFAQEEPAKGKLIFLGVAYDEAPPQGQTVDHYNYAPDNFANLFKAQAKDLFSEIKVDTLKGGSATRAAVAGKLRGLQKVAKAEDTVFLYWGTHGGSDRRGWAANLPGGGNVLGTEIKTELGKLPCSAIVVISTCGSGGFVYSGPQQMDLPPNVAALCACRRQQGTNNELDVSLLEALAGFGDRNRDGQVTIREALEYVPGRYNSITRDYEKTADLQPVTGHGNDVLLRRPLTKTADTHVAVEYQGKWYGATILERQADSVKVRYLGWDWSNPRGTYAFADETVSLERVNFPDSGRAAAEVEWNGTWYPAKVLARSNEGIRIHYVGYPSTDDETVPPSRIRFPFITRVEGQGPRAEAKGPRKK